MFIKFSDKTKNIMVKRACPSRSVAKGSAEACRCNPPCGAENDDENAIYLDEEGGAAEKDIRLKILKEYENK